MKRFSLLFVLAAASLHGQQVRASQAVPRVITQNDLNNLHIYMEAASAASGQLPDKDAIMTALKMENGAAKLVKAIEDGIVVLTGATIREDVWAYEKIAPEKGDLILPSNGIEKLDAASVRKRLGK